MEEFVFSYNIKLKIKSDEDSIEEILRQFIIISIGQAFANKKFINDNLIGYEVEVSEKTEK